MLALIRSLPSGLALIAGLIIGAALAYPAGVFHGSQDGRAIERTAALQRSFDLFQERNRINAEVNALGRDGLCRELGGVWLSDESRCD